MSSRGACGALRPKSHILHTAQVQGHVLTPWSLQVHLDSTDFALGLSANIPKEGRVKTLKMPALPGLFLLQETHPISFFPALPQVSVWQGCQKQESQL